MNASRAGQGLPIHVYVHFPWCLEKCPYCDFVSFKTPREAIDHEGYADAVISEIRARLPAVEGMHLASIFFGGGTPSLWSASALGRVLRTITDSIPAAPNADVEITVECNPTSLDADGARALVDRGVGRLSIGAQSLDREQRAFLGRLHDPKGALVAIEAAVASGARVSADLIFGLPKQSPIEAAAHAARLADLGLGHVSAYSLTIEPGTRFGELARRGRLPVADDDATCDAFLAIAEALRARGFEHYEVSNHAKAGERSRHNVGYWRGAHYLGVGCAAYGALPVHATPTPGAQEILAIRARNVIDPARYVEATKSARSGLPTADDATVESIEPLSRDTLLRERIMLGLRLSDGLDLDAEARALGMREHELWTPSRRRAVASLVAEGLLAREGEGIGRIRIPESRRLRTDGIAARLF
ncbi:MAG: radical SAM family heme chaperone HemW [Polyangiales bacterium]